MFNSILVNSEINLGSFLICLIAALILGFIVAIVHAKTTRSNKNFVSTLVILPMLVTVIIMLVNGEIGTGLAVAGTFSLVRFRSQPGNSKEILSIFFAVAIGLACGTGYIGFASIFTAIVAIVIIIINSTSFVKINSKEKVLKIVVPEDLDYSVSFDEEFKKYLDMAELEKTKTINMGSMFELTYNVKLKSNAKEKEFIDSIRIKNGNLKVVLASMITGEEL